MEREQLIDRLDEIIHVLDAIDDIAYYDKDLYDMCDTLNTYKKEYCQEGAQILHELGVCL